MMEILVRTNGKGSGWEMLEDIPLPCQDIAKRILWQPEDIESSLGCWSTLKSNNTKFVVIEEKYRLTKGRVDVC
jgi:hypothetical protein